MMPSKAHGSAVSFQIWENKKYLNYILLGIHVGSYKKLGVEINLSESLQPLLAETVSIVAGNSSEDFINLIGQKTANNDDQESEIDQSGEKNEGKGLIGNTSDFGGEDPEIMLENLNKENNNDDKLNSEITKIQIVVGRIEQGIKNRGFVLSDTSEQETKMKRDQKGEELQAVMRKLVDVVGRIELGLDNKHFT